MAYQTGPYRLHSSLPVPARPVLYSSRNIEPTWMRYTLDATTGGFEQMTSVAQRVLLLVAFNVPRSKFITDQDHEETRQRIVAALAILTGGVRPTIELQSVDVGSERTGTQYRRVKYRNLTTGLDESVQA